MISEAILVIFVVLLIFGIAAFILTHVYSITTAISQKLGISDTNPNLVSGIAVSALVYLLPIGIIILLVGGIFGSLLWPSKLARIVEFIFMGLYFVFMLNLESVFLGQTFIQNILPNDLLAFMHSSIFNAIVFIALSISAGLNFMPAQHEQRGYQYAP